MVLAVFGLIAAVGCERDCFTNEADLNHYTQDQQLPRLDGNPAVALVPQGLDMKAPPTVETPDLPPRYLTLAEAFALALEHGRIGSQSEHTPGTFSDLLLPFTGGPSSFTDGVRVLALNPAIVATNIESSLSKFDAVWNTSMTWTQTNESTGGNPFLGFNNGQSANFTTDLIKPLPTGGVAGITFTTAYTDLFNPPAGFVNPQYRPSLNFTFEQPLLQGFGVELNEIAPTHPASVLTPYNNSSRTEGVVITRIRFDEQRAEFQRTVHYMLLNVEAAYWNLYGAYWSLYSREQGLRQTYEAWQINLRRYQAGRVSREDLAQTRNQYESFRAQRLAALATLQEDERQLRGLTGLPAEDGTRLLPIDAPTLAPYSPDWATALNDALVLRPELVVARDDLKARQLGLVYQKNLLLPSLQLLSSYNINGLGSQLDGGPNNPTNAFSNLASTHSGNWELGLQLSMPIGHRDAYAALRAAREQLTQSYLTLRDEEERARSFLVSAYQGLFSNYNQIQALRQARIAAGIQLETSLQQYIVGRILLLDLLVAQQNWANALQAEYAAIAQYNISLAQFEFAKGTIMQYDNVYIAEGPLPRCAQVRAVEHERQRELGVVLRERANPVTQAAVCCDQGQSLSMPKLPNDTAPPLPSLFEGATHASGPAAKPATAPATWNPTELSQMGTATNVTQPTTPAPMPVSGAASPLPVGTPAGNAAQLDLQDD